MSTESTESTEPTIPTDLIYQILCYSDPRDIIRWRTVSKVFNAITHGIALWKTLYRNAAFPRPPGPFSTQTVTSLERALLKATQLAESWTTRPMRALSSLTINTGKTSTQYPKLISGRWLVMFESDRLVLHDVDPAAGRRTQVLWEQESPEVSDLDVESIVSSEGHCMVYVMLKLDSYPGWKLLQFQLDYDTGDLLHSATIGLPQVHPRSHLSFRADIYAGNSQLLFIVAFQMVLDTRTHIFYKLPEHPFRCLDPDCIIVSDTSLISLKCFEYKTIVDVFTLPPDSAGGETSLRTLCLTHEDTIYTPFSDVKVMKHAIDPATGATNIRLLNYSPKLGPLYLQRVEMTLPKYSPGVILPINIETHKIQLPRERVRPSRYENHRKYIDILDDGQIRGFFRTRTRERRMRPWDTIENQLVMKFTIDTTHDPWVIARGQIAPAGWSNEVDLLVDPTGKYITFDGMRGRLCYPYPNVPNTLLLADIE